jgi:hypothetical protein
VAGDEVGVDAHPDHAQPAGQVMLPHRGTELRVPVPAEDVIDQDVHVAMVGIDPFGELPDLAGVEVIDPQRDPVTARGGPASVVMPA